VNPSGSRDSISRRKSRPTIGNREGDISAIANTVAWKRLILAPMGPQRSFSCHLSEVEMDTPLNKRKAGADLRDYRAERANVFLRGSHWHRIDVSLRGARFEFFADERRSCNTATGVPAHRLVNSCFGRAWRDRHAVIFFRRRYCSWLRIERRSIHTPLSLKGSCGFSPGAGVARTSSNDYRRVPSAVRPDALHA